MSQEIWLTLDRRESLDRIRIDVGRVCIFFGNGIMEWFLGGGMFGLHGLVYCVVGGSFVVGASDIQWAHWTDYRRWEGPTN